MSLSLADRADQAGIIGASGSGRALAPRLRQVVDIVVANGAECEPLLQSDRILLERQCQGVIRGLTAAMSATGAHSGVLAIRQSQSKALEVACRAIAGMGHLRIHELPDQYPIGDAHLLVPEVTGRVVPEGGRPEGVGVMVSNVQTLWHLSNALEGRSVTWRYVTVGGAVRAPRVLRIPQGMTIREVIALCGGLEIADPIYVLGGPMQGQLVEDDTLALGKAQGGLFVFPRNHPLVHGRLMGVDTRLKQAASACGGCRRCTDYCPRHQLGHRLSPHRLLRSLTQGVEDAEAVISASLCSGCGLCEVICPAGLSPRAAYGAVQQELKGRGFQNLFQNQSPRPTGDLAGRRVPRSQVINRFKLTDFQGPYGVDDVDLSPLHVCIPLTEGVKVVVAEGERVGHGQVIAKPQGEGPWQHASIAGVISKVEPSHVHIVMA